MERLVADSTPALRLRSPPGPASAARSKPCSEQQPADGLAVSDLPSLDHLQRRREAHRLHFEELVFLSAVLAHRQPDGQEEMDALVTEAGRREDRRQEFDTRSGAT